VISNALAEPDYGRKTGIAEDWGWITLGPQQRTRGTEPEADARRAITAVPALPRLVGSNSTNIGACPPRTAIIVFKETIPAR
ncbi:MAG: hypothetical protein WA399_10655, partial [Acidobacteriaceae bacterium]